MRLGWKQGRGRQEVTGTTVAGDLTMIQDVNGGVTVTAVPVVRSGYQEQVRRIAPPALLEREVELAELAAFCTEPDRGTYSWWRAPAWAGKSALMSWFVLHPPESVRMVSFFVTGRYAAQHDRVAFTDVMLEQLAELTGQGIPAYLTDSTRDGHLLRMLEEAAEICQRRDERLVLLVDGLDEDRGLTRPTPHSIAALLPIAPAAGMRVIVASRPNPPVPADVPSRHPLRDPRIVRVLDRSRWAAVAEADMKHELHRLLHGTQVEQDLLGMLTAAVGGLSVSDFAHLTGAPEWDVAEQLQSSSGRTFSPRMSHWLRSAGYETEERPMVYVLGHEDLQVTAMERLGAQRIGEYRDRLHEWADQYRRLGWPAETPEYLLRGYFRLLRETVDLARMISCATDPARHRRLRDLSGGDAEALLEIIVAQDAILSQPDPQLPTMARLAVHRVALTKRAESVRVNLPPVWARLGRHGRAETLARSIPDPGRQAWALAGVARALADTGHIQPAEDIASTIMDPRWQVYAWTGLAKVSATASDLDRGRAFATRAEAALSSLGPVDGNLWAWAELVDAFMAIGETDRARGLAERVIDSARRSGGRDAAGTSSWDLAAVVGPLASAGEVVWAEEVASEIGNPRWQAYAWIGLSKALTAAKVLDRAREFAGHAEAAAELSESPDQQALALAPLVAVYAQMGDLDRAWSVAERVEQCITSSRYYVPYAWAELAKAAAIAGDLGRARVFLERAEASTPAVANLDSELAALVAPLLATNELDRAERVALSIAAPHLRVWALAAVVEATAAAGELHRPRRLTAQAEADALSNTQDPDVRPLTAVVDCASALGDLDRARRLVAEAETIASHLDGPGERALALASVVDAIGAAGDLDTARDVVARAEAIASEITDPTEGPAWALAALAAAIGAAGDRERARELVTRAEDIANSALDTNARDYALANLAAASERAGDLEQAWKAAKEVQSQAMLLELGVLGPVALMDKFTNLEAAISSVTDPEMRGRLLARLAAVATSAGSIDRVRELSDLAASAASAVAEPFMREQILVILVDAMNRVGDINRAETLAKSIPSPARQAWALAGLAALTADQNPGHARQRVASALRVGSWAEARIHNMSPAQVLLERRPDEFRNDKSMTPTRTLAAVDLSALTAMADELVLTAQDEPQESRR